MIGNVYFRLPPKVSFEKDFLPHLKLPGLTNKLMDHHLYKLSDYIDALCLLISKLT